MNQDKKFSGWKDKLQALINQYNHLRYDGKKASGKTRYERATYLFQFMKELRELGYRVDPEGVGLRHIKAICQKYERDGIAAATIQTRISILRVFCTWIGKPGMIGDVKEFFVNQDSIKRTYQATKDKSWDVPEIDKSRLIHEILRDSPYVGHQLLMQDAFGLRRKEAIMFIPYARVYENAIYITSGSKGGKERVIPIEDDYQKEVIARVQNFVGKKLVHLGDPEYDLKGNIAQYAQVVRKYGIKKTGKGALGITGHGLRAGFAMEQMEKRGLKPVLRGGEVGQLPPEEEKRIRIEVSKLLGHNRPQVTTAYSGAMTPIGLTRANAAKAKLLAKAIEEMEPGKIYRFCTIAYELENRPVPAGVVIKEFVGMAHTAQGYEFEVVSEDESTNRIPLGIVDSIEVA